MKVYVLWRHETGTGSYVEGLYGSVDIAKDAAVLITTNDIEWNFDSESESWHDKGDKWDCWNIEPFIVKFAKPKLAVVNIAFEDWIKKHTAFKSSAINFSEPVNVASEPAMTGAYGMSDVYFVTCEQPGLGIPVPVEFVEYIEDGEIS